MATVNLLPNSVDSSGADWTNVGGASAHASLTDDDTSNYIKSTSAGKYNTFGMGNFGEDFSSITSIKIVIKARETSRGGAYTIDTKILNAGGSTLYEEDFSNSATLTYNTHNGTARTTSDGSNAWTDGDLDGIQIKLTGQAVSGDTRITYAYIEVTYATGYANDIAGVAAANIGSVMGVAAANIDKVIGS